MQAALEFRLPARVRKKGKWYVSSCPALDVHSQGRTSAEARQNLADALAFFLESCFERGTVADVLRAAGLA
jgi:predicted RNase H-like HicB family nuclease